jgi:acyl carrier protein
MLAFVPEADAVTRLLRLLGALGYPDATAADDLLALGLTSLQLMQFDADIEREFAVTVDPAFLLGGSTIGDLAGHLGTARPYAR